MTRSPGHPAAGDGPQRLRACLPVLPFLPLLITAAPRSFLAHDEGYYALQARWIAESGQWLAPLWWGEPLYDRTIGVQWLIALAQRLLGPTPWVAHLPGLLAAAACLLLTAALARELLGRGSGWLSALVLALTPLWINHAHQAGQDIPLLALELLGFWALVRARPDGPWWAIALAAGWVGPAFLIKGFLVAVPLAAMAPFALLRRRWLLARPSFWGWLLLGWLPVALWLGLSLRTYGPTVVGGLVEKLLYLSQSDVYSAGPLYYLWNIPANTAPWCLAGIGGWWLGLRRWTSEQRLALIGTPLLLALLLSCFRTKTPYYGLQLTPFVAIAAAHALRRFSQTGQARPRWLAWLIGALGALLAVGGAVVLAMGLVPWPFGLAGLGLGISWLLLPWQHRRRSVLIAGLAGPWLALVLLVQTGLFTDRSPQLRQALAAPATAEALRQGPVAVVAPEPLSGDGHAQLILLALGTPQLGPRLADLNALAPGQRAWVPRQLARSPAGAALQPLAAGDDLGEWMLVRARP